MSQPGQTHCGEAWPAGSKYCGKCGAVLNSPGTASAITPSVSGGASWSRPHGVMAQRIDVPDLQGLLAKHLDIVEGTRGLLFQHGKYVGTLEPGQHTLATVTQRLKSLVLGQPAFAVVMDAGILRLELSCPGLLSRDSHEINASAQLALSLADPGAFFVNVMRGDDSVRTESVVALFRPTAVGVVQRLVREASLDDLAHDDELLERLDDELRAALQAQLQDIGLTFLRVDHAGFDCPARESIQRQHAQLNLAEAQQKLRDRSRKLQHQIDKEATDDRMATVRSEQELVDFLTDVQAKADEDRKKREFRGKELDLARQKHWEVVYHDFAKLKDDLAAKREFLKAQAELEYRRELAELEHTVERDQLVRRHERNDLELAHELDTAQKHFDTRIEREHQQLSHELSQAVKKTESEAALRAIHRKVEEEDAESERNREKSVHAQQMQRVRDAIGVNTTYQDSEQARDLQKQTAETDTAIRQADAEVDRKVRMAQGLAGLNAEALMTVSTPEQANLLGEQAKLQLMQGMSADQIVAFNSSQSPELAQSLATMAQANAAIQAGQENASKEHMERLLAQQQEASAAIQATLQNALGMAERMNEVALHTQRDTAVAAASSQTPQQPKESVTEVVKVRCPNPECGILHDTDVKFCNECGSTLRGQ